MRPRALPVAVVLVASSLAAHAQPPHDAEPALRVVELERSGLDVERALSALTRGAHVEVVLADHAARVGSDAVVVLARRCEAARCAIIAARFKLMSGTVGPALVATHALADVAPDTTPGPLEAAPSALADGDTVLVGWRSPNDAERVALRVGDLEPTTALFETGMDTGGSSTTFLTIWRDGRWSTQGPSGGRLTSEELAALVTRMRDVRWTTHMTPPCPGRPERIFVRTHAGKVRYASGCGPAPDASVLALVAEAEGYTTRRPNPVLIKLRRWSVSAPDRIEAAFVMRTGVWTTHNGRGTLATEALAELTALLDAALLEAPPIAAAAVCRGDRPHELEVPGRGAISYVWPCHRPSPTLEAALQRLYTLVGLGAP